MPKYINLVFGFFGIFLDFLGSLIVYVFHVLPIFCFPWFLSVCLGFFRIPLDSLILSVSVRLSGASFGFFRILSDLLGIWTHSLIISRILRILLYSLIRFRFRFAFFRILSDSLGLSKMPNYINIVSEIFEIF